MIDSSHNNSNLFNFTENSIFFDQDLSSIKYLNESKEKDVKNQKKTPKNNKNNNHSNNNSINRTLNSFSSFNN